MMIFETNRLVVRSLTMKDEVPFSAMMGNANVRRPIPRKVLTPEESNLKLKKLIRAEQKDNNKIWAVVLKSTNEFIGLAGFVNNNDVVANELAYVFREKFWGNGYATEITEGLISYGFEQLNFDEIRADVCIDNIGSIKVLDKFLNRVKEVFNAKDNCMDRCYNLDKKDWKHLA